MDIRETKQIVCTDKHSYVLAHNYCYNNYNNSGCFKVNGVEIISKSLQLRIYIITSVINTNGVCELIMKLSIEDCNGVTIARFRNIDVNKIDTYDFDEELYRNLLIIVDEIEKKERCYNNKIKKTK